MYIVAYAYCFGCEEEGWGNGRYTLRTDTVIAVKTQDAFEHKTESLLPRIILNYRLVWQQSGQAELLSGRSIEHCSAHECPCSCVTSHQQYD